MTLQLPLPSLEILLRIVLKTDPRKPVKRMELHQKTIKVLDFISKSLQPHLPPDLKSLNIVAQNICIMHSSQSSFGDSA